MSKHTPGPWRWEFNGEHRSLHLVGGRPRYDLTIMDFKRWGMDGATMRLRDPAHDGMQLLYRVHERPDWIAPEAGREHHKDWHQLLTHPDARLIAAAPELLEALKECLGMLESADCSTGYCCCGSSVNSHGFGDGHSPVDEGDYHQCNTIERARAAIAKADGA